MKLKDYIDSIKVLKRDIEASKIMVKIYSDKIPVLEKELNKLLDSTLINEEVNDE